VVPGLFLFPSRIPHSQCGYIFFAKGQSNVNGWTTGLPMLSFRDAAIPNAERNHWSTHEQDSLELWNAHTATGRQAFNPRIVDLVAVS